MNLDVLRPMHGDQPFPWVHLENPEHPGQPLCGAQESYQLRSEFVALGSCTICAECLHARDGYRVTLVSKPDARSTSDREYVYEIEDLRDPPRTREEALSYAVTSVRQSYIKEEMPNWASPERVSFERAGDKWRYTVREAYTG